MKVGLDFHGWVDEKYREQKMFEAQRYNSAGFEHCVSEPVPCGEHWKLWYNAPTFQVRYGRIA